MKPSAVIHIGVEKTGSTSIQQFLSLNRAELRKSGFYVPSFLGRTNHRLLPFLAYSEKREDEFTIRNNLTPGSRKRIVVQRNGVRSIKLMAKHQAGSKWIISSEHIHSRLTTSEEISRFKELLDDCFSDYSFLIYVRKPIDLAVSLYSTAIKDGHHLEDLPSPTHPYWGYLCNYKDALTRWQKVFKDKTFNVRLYDKSQFFQGSLIADFCRALDISHSCSTALPKPLNQSLGIDALRLLNALNRIRSQHEFNSVYTKSSNTKAILPFFEKAFPYNGNSFSPTPAQIVEYHKEFHESNQWLLGNFTKLSRDYWIDPLDHDAKCVSTSNLSVTDSEQRLVGVIYNLHVSRRSLLEPKLFRTLALIVFKLVADLKALSRGLAD